MLSFPLLRLFSFRFVHWRDSVDDMAKNRFCRPLVLLCLCLSAPLCFADEKPITLDDLGFTKSDTQGNPELQLQLEKRTSMLKTHQTLGLITAIPMIAQFFLAQGANHSEARRNLHMEVGIATAGLYGTTAAFAIFAPKPDGIVDQGHTVIHRDLAWVHGPLMVITPILGGIADSQLNHHEKVHGIASLHGAAATALLVSYLASIAVMSFNF